MMPTGRLRRGDLLLDCPRPSQWKWLLFLVPELVLIGAFAGWLLVEAGGRAATAGIPIIVITEVSMLALLIFMWSAPGVRIWSGGLQVARTFVPWARIIHCEVSENLIEVQVRDAVELLGMDSHPIATVFRPDCRERLEVMIGGLMPGGRRAGEDDPATAYRGSPQS